MDPDESVRFFRRYAAAVLNGLFALGCASLVLVMYLALGSIDGGDTGSAVGLLSLAIILVGGLAVAFALLSLGYYLLARHRVDGPHRGLDVGTASALAFVPAIAILHSSEATGLLVGGLAMLGEVAGLVVAVLDR